MLLLMLVQHTKTIFMGMVSIQVGEKNEKPEKNLFIWNSAHATGQVACHFWSFMPTASGAGSHTPTEGAVISGQI